MQIRSELDPIWTIANLRRSVQRRRVAIALLAALNVAQLALLYVFTRVIGQ